MCGLRARAQLKTLSSLLKSGHFINICIINRTLHGCLGIQRLSSRAESISDALASLTHEGYFQHLKIKFVSLRGHVISSMTTGSETYRFYTHRGICDYHRNKMVITKSMMKEMYGYMNIIIFDQLRFHY